MSFPKLKKKVFSLKLIPHSVIKGVISPSEAFELVKENFINKSNFLLPPKISLKYNDENFFNTMPCIKKSGGEYITGVKLVSRHLGRTPTLTAKILIFDSITGETLALLDGDYITAFRTGAVAALAAETFAVKNYKRIGFFGLGNTAYATFDILSTVKKNIDQPLEVYLLRYKNQAEKFIQRFNNLPNVKFIVVESYAEVIKNSQVLFSCVSNMDGIFCEAEEYPKGILVVPVHTKGFQNCDLVFDKIFADDTGHIKGFKYFPQFSKLNYCGEFTDVLNGKNIGRANESERILSYNIGIAIHDITFAYEIYKRVGNLCQEIDLQSPDEKIFY